MRRPGRRDRPARVEPAGGDAFHELLRRARDGDRIAAATLLAQHAGHLHGVARRALSPTLRRLYDTLDVTQSVARELLARLPALEDRGEAAFRRWITLVARGKAGEKARRLRRGGPHAEREAGGRAELEPARDEGPDDAVARAELAVRVADGLDRLDALTRAVVLRRARDGDEFATIAATLGLPSADAARKRYTRALAELRDVLRV